MNKHSIKGAENQPETRSITDLLPTARKTNKKPQANSKASQKTSQKREQDKGILPTADTNRTRGKRGGNAARDNPDRGPICRIMGTKVCTYVDLSSLPKKGDLKVR
jgi:hypothetical protein